MEEIYFINNEGKKISLENAKTHEEIAYKIIENSSDLRDEFKQSKEKNPVIFLIIHGYLHISEDKDNKSITIMYSGLSLNEKMNEIKTYFENSKRIEYKILNVDLITEILESEDIEKIEKKDKRERNRKHCK